tara:strand:- start:8 stop:721 length:714 start_codon:yes stop_codon:yes gene_type:complete
MTNYLKANSDYWSQAIYDTPNTETYVFRIYGRIIKHEFNMDGSNKEKLLDFGCGAGGNTKFFANKGFDVFGVDQSKVDIDRCKERIPNKKNQIKVVSPICRENDDWFNGTKFKIITSWQTLYYLSNSDLEKRLKSLYDMLEVGGIFIATMMASSCWYYDMSSPYKDGMRFVKFYREQDVGRAGLTLNDHYINFTKDDEELREKFKLFKPIHSKGSYDGIYRDDQGSEKHLVFVGQKL